MRVLIACEYSGVVRDAFIAKGHEAISCDLLQTESPGPHHVGDVSNIIADGWDLMIAHPPCTYLCSSGLHWNGRIKGRDLKTAKALEFISMLMSAPIARWAIENPVGCIGTKIRPASQTIQPWQYGHPDSKRTCLWLHGLPLLKPTEILPLPKSGRWSNQTASGQNRLSPSPDRWKERSRTYQGIADAMASQWGSP